MGILTLAMAFGGLGAVVALIAGQSLLTALAIYSGCGLISVLAAILCVIAMSALRGRKTDLIQTNAIAGN